MLSDALRTAAYPPQLVDKNMPTIEATTVTSMMAVTTFGGSCNKSIALSINEDKNTQSG
jgi:hypothetical protein